MPTHEKETLHKELTASVHSPHDGDPEGDPVYVRTRTMIIRVGTLGFIALAFALFIPLIVGVGRGIANERVWDPYTGDAVYSRAQAGDTCAEDGRKLLLEAGRLGSLVRVWHEPYIEWQTRCRDKNLELYKALTQTRDELRERGE